MGASSEGWLVLVIGAYLLAPVALAVAVVVQGRRRTELEAEVRRLAAKVEVLGRRQILQTTVPPPLPPPLAMPPVQPASPAAAPRVVPASPPPPLPPPAPAPSPPPPPPPAPASASASGAKIDWESLVGVRLFSWVAGVALLVAAISFLRWSIEHGWLGPAVRAAIGALVGVGLLVGAETGRARRYAVTAQSLAAAGVGILFATVFAAHALWDLLPAVPTFALLVLVAAVAMAYAVRRSSLTMALLGLAGGFATPILLSTGQDQPIGLFSYLLLLNVGLAWVAHKRRWPVLGAIALGVTALYQLGWVAKFLGDENLAIGAVIFLVFPAFGFLALLTSRRGLRPGEALGDLARWTAALGAVPSALFLLRAASTPALGGQWPLVLGFAVVLCAGLLLVAALQGPEWLHLLGTAAAVGAFALLARGHVLPDDAWPLVLLPLLALGAVLIGGPIQLELRRKPLLAEGRLAVHAVPVLVALVLWRLVPQYGPSASDLLFLAAGLLLLTAAAAAVAARARDGKLLCTGGAAALVAGLALAGAEWNEPGTAVATGLLLGAIGPAALLGAARGRPPRPSTPWLAAGAAALLVAGQLTVVAAGDRVAALAMVLPVQVLLLAGLLVVAARTGFHAVSLAAAGTSFLAAAPFAFGAPARAADALGLAGALWTLQLIAPWLQLRRGATSRLLLWAPVAASGLALLLVRESLHRLHLQSLVGPAALLLAAALVPHLRLLVRAPGGLEAERSRIVVVAGAILALVTAAIPLQLEKEWITIGWAVLVPALALLHARLPHRGLLAWMAGLSGAVVIRLALNESVLRYHPRSGTPVWNFWLYAYGVPALALLLAARVLPKERDRLDPGLPRLAPVLAALGGLLLFLLLNVEIADAFSSGSWVQVRLSGSLAYDLALTIGWACFAIGLLVAGLLSGVRPARLTAIALLAVTVVKGFLLDLGRLDGLYRVGSFVGLGVSLALVAVLLQKFVLKERGSSEAPR